MKRRLQDEPNMSDASLLIKVEDLINIAMGPSDKNIVNYKIVQTILHILSRQLRLLETQVEIRSFPSWETDVSPRTPKAKVSSRESTNEKTHRGASKERGKPQRATTKDKDLEKAGTATAKEKKAEPSSAQDTKAHKTGTKEQERGEKEKEKTEKPTTKDKDIKDHEKADRGHHKAGKGKGRGPAPPATGVIVTEKQGQKEKTLVVERGPTTRTGSRTRVGSIEVVTVSQFELLEAAVKQLKAVAGPLPTPALPDNQKLRDDLIKGTASLTDTMQAMQLTARIQAAEKAIGCMADLITQLAASGAIPEALINIVEDVKAGVEETITAAATAGVTEMVSRPSTATRKSVAIDKNAIQPSETHVVNATSRKSAASRMSTMSGIQSRPSTVAPSHSTVSTRSSMTSRNAICISHKEMDDALQSLKEDLTKQMNAMTAKATTAADTAVMTAKAASYKSDIATKLDTRITALNSLVSDYAEQLSGFDSGLTTQMQSFQEQMAQMRSDLTGGLELFKQANTNAETAAVMELNERYQGLVSELDTTLHAHQELTRLEKQLDDQLRSLVERVEMLQEEKADRDEVLDGLRDKADISRLTGLLTEWDFAAARAELERRLQLCYDKFKKQETIWLGALRDLTEITEKKAEIMQLLAMRDDAQQQLRDIHKQIHKLSEILGEPKAAMITRFLSRDATCGACMIPALMEQTDISYGAPPPLPALRPRPTGAPSQPEEPYLVDWKPIEPPDTRIHTCHRWVGGSHTLLSDAVTREHAGPVQFQILPTKRFAGYGTDGRLYMMEEELQPCLECNVISDEPVIDPQGAGDGDQGVILSLTG